MRISEYLGKDYDDEFYDTVEKKCTFTSMNKDKVTNQAWTVLSKDGKSPIYRKGIVFIIYYLLNHLYFPVLVHSLCLIIAWVPVEMYLQRLDKN